ncbi:hypothetical protein ABG768_014020 [Culter alburnus]|uniref:Secreted protein n=1 Tax=Culter alburnus TaxID=194366 RepID=A0AAW1Z8C8_CULAL
MSGLTATRLPWTQILSPLAVGMFIPELEPAALFIPEPKPVAMSFPCRHDFPPLSSVFLHRSSLYYWTRWFPPVATSSSTGSIQPSSTFVSVGSTRLPDSASTSGPV